MYGTEAHTLSGDIDKCLTNTHNTDVKGAQVLGVPFVSEQKTKVSKEKIEKTLDNTGIV